MDIDKIELPTMPKIGSPKEWPFIIRKKLKEYYRVLKITKKPNKEEFITVSKLSGLGILIIGVIGFAIFLIVELLKIYGK
jgi:protein transport protein SEC61 subunit gamma and related proteins